jgi:hypothetical protein
MAMREGIETRRKGDNFFCYSSLATLMAARGDVAGAESLLLEGAAIEDEEGDGGENCYEFLDEIKERYGDPASFDPSVLLVEGASDSSPETLKRRGVASGWHPEDDALLAAGVAHSRPAKAIGGAALLRWCLGRTLRSARVAHATRTSSRPTNTRAGRRASFPLLSHRLVQFTCCRHREK